MEHLLLSNDPEPSQYEHDLVSPSKIENSALLQFLCVHFSFEKLWLKFPQVLQIELGCLMFIPMLFF